MRDAAAAVLAKHGALELFGAREATRLELEKVRRDLSVARGEVAWWERPTGAHSVAPIDPLVARATELEAADTVRLAALNAALDAAQAEMPPIAIVRRVASCFLLARGAGVASANHDEALVIALESLADAVLSIWAPGLSPEAAANELMDPARAAAAAVFDPGALREDPVLGWAPATPGEILSRAARALQRPEIEGARALLVRERAEYESMAARLRELRKSASSLRRLVSDDPETDTAIDYTKRRVAMEEHELTAAWETLHHEVSRALAAVPPLHVARAAVAAAGVLRARLTTWELVIGIDTSRPGALVFMRSVSRRGRAVMFAALRELKLATEHAFPGLLSLLTPRGAAEAAREKDVAGPYRARGELDGADDHAPTKNADLLETVIQRAKARGLDQRVGALVAHGAALGSLSRHKRHVEGERGLFDRMTSWVSSEDDPLEARARWHRALAFSMLDQAEATVAAARSGLFALDLRAALTAAAAQFAAIQMFERRGLFDVDCTLVRKEETLAALLAARRFLVAAWGDPGDRLALANDVARYIASTPPGPSPFGPGSRPRRLERHELVVLLGEVLRSSPYLDAANRAVEAQRRFLESTQRVEGAKARITFWDQLNFFTDSDAEATVKAQRQIGEEQHAHGRVAFAETNDLLEQALAHYPPAVVLYRLEEAMAFVQAIAVIKVMSGSRSQHVACRMIGHAEAQMALHRLATAAGRTFGVMLSDTEILAHYWERQLDAEP